MSNFTKLLLKYLSWCMAACIIIGVTTYGLAKRSDSLCNDFEKQNIDIGYSYSCRAIWIYSQVKLTRIGPIQGDCGFFANKIARESCEQDILKNTGGKQEDVIFSRTDIGWVVQK